MSKDYFSLPILVVDDDAMVREIVVEYLKSFGFSNITELKDSIKAMKMLQTVGNDIGLVISDWEMPTPNGIDLLRTMKQLPHRSETKFIMITSQKSMERLKIAQAGALGVSAYIVKPFRSKILKDKIWEVLGIEDDAESA